MSSGDSHSDYAQSHDTWQNNNPMANVNMPRLYWANIQGTYSTNGSQKGHHENQKMARSWEAGSQPSEKSMSLHRNDQHAVSRITD